MIQNIKKFISSSFNLLLDQIVPRRKDYLLVENINLETILTLPKASTIEENMWITSLFQYHNNLVRAMIWELKYRGITFPLEHVAKLLFDEIQMTISDKILFEADAIFLLIPIPISPSRRAKRGYNQSEYIARAILEHDTQRVLLYAPQWLSKIQETHEQNKTQSREERVHNLRNCFRADKQVAGKYVILIDDVVTTSSTLTEARRTLENAGAREVFAFTIAH